MRDTTKGAISSAAGCAGRNDAGAKAVAGGRSGPSLVAALLLPLTVTAAVTLAGCGGDGEPVTQSGQRVRGPVVERATPAARALPDAETASVQAPAAVTPAFQGPATAPTSAESLPPDVLVTVGDTLVVPGAAVEITAQATSDVSQLVLWDGIGDREAFTYDSDAGVWRAVYRVPLKAPWERIGLSVTARNDGDRWRRVWVFLRLREPAAAPSTDVADGS